jgi:hypothetical protein
MHDIGLRPRFQLPGPLGRKGVARLLVSVASKDEIAPALAGGAQILDVKDPGQGSLGVADPGLVLAARMAAPDRVPVSAALGDALPRGRSAAAALTRRARELSRAGAEVLKIGLAGAGGMHQAQAVLETLRSRLAESEVSCARLVAVAFADETGSGAIRPLDLPELVRQAGLDGAMLDTLSKGRSILCLVGEAELRAWVEEVRRAGRFLCGLAGSLRLEDVARVGALGPDVLGVRGAVCEGGRAGRLSRDLVRQAAEGLEAALPGEADRQPAWS